MKTFLLLTLSALFLSGCGSLIPSERKSSESVKASEAIATAQNQTVRRTLEVVPEMANKIAQWGSNVSSVSLPAIREQVEVISSSDSNAGTKEQAFGSNAVSIPLGVKLGLIGVGIAIIVGALLFAWRSVKSTSFGQGLALADEALARQVRSWRNYAATVRDPEEQSEANAEIAELEAERGRLATQKK
jgi:hypothetical protein